MIEKFLMILDKIVAYLILLSQRPFVTFTLIDLLIVTAMASGIYFAVKYSFKAFMLYGLKGFMIASKPVVILYEKNKKHRHNKKICHVCKNPLDKCTCQANRGVPYKQRVVKWKATQDAINTVKKTKEQHDKEISKPVELRKKPNGGR